MKQAIKENDGKKKEERILKKSVKGKSEVNDGKLVLLSEELQENIKMLKKLKGNDGRK